ncbi:MAG: 30S ribosome-binding factor RbfA [Acidimicrobiales bacterium]
MANQRRYPRTARLNVLLREILADELERIDDEQLYLVTIMDVSVDADLHHAKVLVETPEGAERDAAVLEALEVHRSRLQKAIARQARLKRTPLLAFAPDDVTRTAARLEQVIAEVEPPSAAL